MDESTVTAPAPAHSEPADTPPAPRPVRILAEGRPDSATPDAVVRRWRVIAVLLLLTYLAFSLQEAASFLSGERWFQPVLVAAAAILQAGVASLLAWRPGPRRVRAAEWGSIGVACLLLASIQFEHLSDPGLAGYFRADRPVDSQVLVGNTWALPWFALVVGYGTLTRTTGRAWRRVVGGMAAMPCLVAAAAVVASPSLRAASPWVVLGQIAFWMALGVALAAYGSHRLDGMRREVRAARQLGQYRLVRRLGGGGMGEVHLAEHALLRRPCAVKLIRVDRAADPRWLRRFEREVRAMASLTHWNTAEVFDYGQAEDGTFYYVMEYLPGLTLEQLARLEGSLPAGRVIHVLRQACAALAEAHAAGLVHRDLKPSNVIVCERGRVGDVVKLVDFGLVRLDELAQTDDRLTDPDAIMGTPAFMSPEQAAGRDADARSDIYSLGATAWFLLAGRHPFPRANAKQVLAAHLLDPPESPSAVRPGVPDDLAAVVLRCLAKSPSERYPSADALDAALAACADADSWPPAEASEWWRRWRQSPGEAETAPPAQRPAAVTAASP